MKKYDRRTALVKMLGLGASVVGAGLCTSCPGGSTYYRDMAEAQEGSGGPEGDGSMTYLKRQVRDGEPLEITVQGRTAYLYKEQQDGAETWLAVDRRCTHTGCKVNFNRETTQYVCPCHGSKFAADGERLSGPAKRPLKTWEVVVDQDSVTVVVEAEKTA